jgi:hypothetical protein
MSDNNCFVDAFCVESLSWSETALKGGPGEFSCSGASIAPFSDDQGKKKLLFINGLFWPHHLLLREYLPTIRVLDVGK